jgi:hypothetical protein
MDMFMLTIYMLVWPVVVGGTLYVIARAFFREWIECRREGRSII